MRFLCLHGMGTSGAIFSAQTSAFRSKLDPQEYIFDFVDAPHESGPAWGVEAFFPPPNYTFWQSIDPGNIAEAHHWLLSHINQQREPYDAVLCFSQGCAVISSLILHHNNEHPEQPLPFKAAVFICGGIPLDMLSHMGLPVPPAAWEINNATGQQLHKKAGAAGEEIKALMKSGNVRQAMNRGLWDRTDGLSHQVPRNYDPLRLPPSLQPTNVYGWTTRGFRGASRSTYPPCTSMASKTPGTRARCSSHISAPRKRGRCMIMGRARDSEDDQGFGADCRVITLAAEDGGGAGALHIILGCGGPLLLFESKRGVGAARKGICLDK